MTAAPLQPGVVVKANKLGREFRARLTGKPAGGRVQVEPLDRHITYRQLRTSEIREVLSDPAQLQLGGAVTVVDKKGLRLAREVRAALRAREEDQDLQAAIEVYDRAVTPGERQAAAAYLLIHTTKVDERYTAAATLAYMRILAPELLPPGERE